MIHLFYLDIHVKCLHCKALRAVREALYTCVVIIIVIVLPFTTFYQ